MLFLWQSSFLYTWGLFSERRCKGILAAVWGLTGAPRTDALPASRVWVCWSCMWTRGRGGVSKIHYEKNTDDGCPWAKEGSYLDFITFSFLKNVPLYTFMIWLDYTRIAFLWSLPCPLMFLPPVVFHEVFLLPKESVIFSFWGVSWKAYR